MPVKKTPPVLRWPASGFTGKIIFMAVACLAFWPAKGSAQAPGNVAAPSPVASTARTQMVLSSHEPVAAPFPTVDKLPKTISFDPMTEAEVQQIRKDIFVVLSPPNNGKGMTDNCMQWVFVRNGKKEPWRGIGALRAGRGIVKINGAFRHSLFAFGMEYKSGFLGRLSPSDKPGAGRAAVISFDPKSTFAQFLKDESTDHDWSWKFNQRQLDPSLRGLDYASTKEVLIDERKMKCSYLKAHCRRYAFPLRRAYWIGESDHKTSEEEFGAAPGLSLEMAIEDMCPYDYGSVLESTINTRGEGKGVAILRYGFPRNPKLIDAIRPYL